MAHIEGDAGQQMGGADGGEVNAQGADGDMIVGAFGGVHGDQVGVAGERFAAE